MVNFDSITIGLEVEFQVEDGSIERGIVRYKGPVNGKPGDWVGVEANRSVGYCDGRIMGRTYFKCPDRFGLFLSANDIRLASRTKKKKNSLYKSVGSHCDDLLFRASMPKEQLNVITQDYLRRAKSAFVLEEDYSSVFNSAPKFAIRDSLVVAQKKKKDPIKKTTDSSFQPVASVRQSFMPQEEMQLYSKINWSYKNKNVSLPREKNNLSTTFDGFNKQRSNYIDPSL